MREDRNIQHQVDLENTIRQLTAKVVELEDKLVEEKQYFSLLYDRSQRLQDWWLTAKKERDETQATNAVLRAALEEIRDAKTRWRQDVGSYAGGETYAGFASRLQQIAEAALSSEAVATKETP